MIKYYVLINESDEITAYAANTKLPKGAIRAPADEDQEWLEIYEEVDELTEETIKKCRVNEATKSSVQAARASASAIGELRAKRDRLLQQTDYTQLPDAPLTEQQKADYATYRQELRDLPANTVDPANPVWPSEPGS